MIIRGQREVDPHALLLGDGGSVASAMRFTGDFLRDMAEAGVKEPHVSWVAVVTDRKERGLGTVQWDPSTPIPEGTIVLRATGWSRR